MPIYDATTLTRDPIGMDTSKRRRTEDDDAGDRLVELPDCILHDILSRIGPHQAVQTSVLSHRWRHLWRDVLRKNVIIDEREFAGVQWERFEDFADHVLLSIPPEKKLDFFHLNLVSPRRSYNPTFEISDRWIRRGLRYCPAAVDIRTAHDATICWKPHWSYLSAPSPQPDLSASGLCAAGFTGRLTTLRLLGVGMSATFVEDLGRYCPVLEDLHVERCRIAPNLSTVASPTLRSLAIVEPRRPLTCAHLRIVAPLLARLRLELAYDGQDCRCVAGAAALATGRDVPPQLPLLTVAEASIRLTDTSFDGQGNERARKKRKLEFLKTMRGLVALLPNVIDLQLAGFTTMALIEEEFPVLHCLKILVLERCDLGVEFQSLTGILPNTPGLENLGLHHCTFLAKKRRNRSQQPSKERTTTPYDFWTEKLKSIEIKKHQQDEPQIAKVLAEVSKRMQPELWQQVTISSTIV